MLCELVVHNLVIVAQASLVMGQGLTVISGETGAGKSLLLDALDLLLGGRGRANLVGPHADAVVVSGVFQLDGAIAADLLEGIPIEDGQLVLRRRLTSAGRSQAWINDVPVAIGALRALGAQLVDIRVQHEHLRLADPARQLALIDRYADHCELAASYSELHERCLALEGERARLAGIDADSLRELDYLRFLVQELHQLAPQPGELVDLEERQRLLAGAQEWTALAAEAVQTLSDDDDAVLVRLRRLVRRLDEAPVGALREAGVALVQAAELVAQAAVDCASAVESIATDPEELQRVEERYGAFLDLMRKHGGSEEAMLEAWRRYADRITQLENRDLERGQVDVALAAATAQRSATGKRLAAARRKGFRRLAERVHEELAELGMPKARLRLHEEEEDVAPGPLGTVAQSLWVATNPGLPEGPLAEVASGGESARLTLALAVALAEQEETPVLVFDEVDSGVGGRLGSIMGRKLAGIAKRRSVLAVTHTPQLAAWADHHFQVSKRQDEASTAVVVEALEGPRRLAELADMLGGGPAACDQARALLAEAGQEPPAVTGGGRRRRRT